MPNRFGTLFTITTWGESHGPAIGVVIDGCPPGLPITADEIQVELDRRRPGQSDIVTPRKEADAVEILSGVYEGRTTGTPISLVVRNTDQRPAAYDEMKDKYRAGGYGYGHAKLALFEAIERHLGHKRAEYDRLMANTKELEEILVEGARRARRVAQETVGRVREKVGFHRRPVSLER